MKLSFSSVEEAKDYFANVGFFVTSRPEVIKMPYIYMENADGDAVFIAENLSNVIAYPQHRKF